MREEYKSEMRNITEFSEEEAWEALKNGINIPYKINNKTYMFLGITAIGTSSNESFQSKQFFQEVQKQYIELTITRKNYLISKIKKINNNIMTNIDIHICIKEGLLFFIEENSKMTIKFEEDNLYISPKYCEIGYHSYDFNS